jgi:hypothetical protein
MNFYVWGLFNTSIPWLWMLCFFAHLISFLFPSEMKPSSELKSVKLSLHKNNTFVGIVIPEGMRFLEVGSASFFP